MTTKALFNKQPVTIQELLEPFIQSFFLRIRAELKPLADDIKSLKNQSDVEYLTMAQVCEMLHISRPTLNKLRSINAIVAVQSSDNRVLFRRSQIEAYLASKQQKGGKKRE